MGGKKGDEVGSGVSRHGYLICCRPFFIIPFIRTVIVNGGTSGKGNVYVICTA